MKWRGVLFLRFLLSLVDESEKIRRLADFLFGNILKGMKLCGNKHEKHSFIPCYINFLQINMIGSILINIMPILLTVKAPLLAYNSFVEAIYVLNDCHAHNGHNNSDSKQSRTKDQAFTIRYSCYT